MSEELEGYTIIDDTKPPPEACFLGHTTIFIRENPDGFCYDRRARLVQFQDRMELLEAIIRREANTEYPPGTLKVIYLHHDAVRDQRPTPTWRRPPPSPSTT
jgi:hypothetical protein